jgi:serine/threonine protein kinase, bacterial
MLKAVIHTTANLIERPFSIGRLIQERYEIVEFLGRGSHGNSYLVWDQKTHRKVVLKCLRVHKRMLRSGRMAFQQEFQLLKETQQAYFPLVFEYGQYNNVPYFTMEYVGGKTFEQLIFEEGKTYSEQESFQVGYELLQIMKWLHHDGIVHRDIRIPNVINEHNGLRLIDFGLARRFDTAHLPAVMHDSIKKMISPVSDFYALGHFLLFLLYSTYEPVETTAEQSWESELTLSSKAHAIIRKLLAIDEPYQICEEIEQDILSIIRRK